MTCRYKKSGHSQTQTLCSRETLYSFEHAKKRDLPVFKMLEILAEGKVNSVSFTRTSPYFRFYASTNGESQAIITINTDEGEYETVLDLSELIEPASSSSP